jgi:hypothetical protein
MMHRRCYDKNFDHFNHYGGRGISVCTRWHKSNDDGFLNFYLDMGNPPPNKSLDRIDVDRDYSPQNCQWSSNSTQQKSRRKFGSLTSFNPNELGDHISNMTTDDILKMLRQALRKRNK